MAALVFRYWQSKYFWIQQDSLLNFGRLLTGGSWAVSCAPTRSLRFSSLMRCNVSVCVSAGISVDEKSQVSGRNSERRSVLWLQTLMLSQEMDACEVHCWDGGGPADEWQQSVCVSGSSPPPLVPLLSPHLRPVAPRLSCGLKGEMTSSRYYRWKVSLMNTKTNQQENKYAYMLRWYIISVQVFLSQRLISAQ